MEAESTAYVVCHALGLDTGCASFPYVATWAQKAGTADGEDAAKMVAASGQRIHTAAGRILDSLLGSEAEEKPKARRWKPPSRWPRDTGLLKAH